MIGNNDWLDYMEYRDHIAHSMGMWDKSKVKYKDKIPVGGGKFRYIYDEPRNPRSRGRMEPRTVQQQRAMGRSGGMQRVSTNSRQASRPVSFRDRGNQIRAGRDAERRDMERQGMQNRTANNQQIEANKLARGYSNQQRAAQQQMTQNRMATDAAMSQKPKNLFDHMGNALNAAGRMAGDAARGVSNWVGDRAREVGEAASGAWNNVTGGDGRLDLDDIRRGADSALKGASRAIGLEARSDLDAARNREATAREMRDIRRVENEAANNPNVGKSEESKAGYRDRYTQAAQDHGAASRDLREAQRAYDNTLAGRVENTANAAGNWLGDAARNVGNWIGDRAADARDAVSGMVDNAGRSLGSVYDQMSGREDGSTWNNITGGDNHFNYEDVGNVMNAAGRRAQNVGDWVGDRAREAQGAASDIWDRATAGDGRFDLEDVNRIAGDVANRVGNAARSAGQWMGDRAGEARDAISRGVDQLGARAGSAYDRMTGREDGTTWNNVTGGDNHFNYGDAQNVMNAAGRRARNLYDQAGNAIGGVGDWIGDRANDAGYQLAERASELGNALRDGRDFIADRTGISAKNNLEAARNYEAQTRDTRDLARIAYRNTPNNGYQARYTDAAQAHGAAQRDLREAQNAYNNSSLGRAESFARGVGEAAGNAVSSARNLISTAGGNIAQALSWANQRLRYAQNTGNPEMIQDAQEVIRTLESPAFNFRDRMN